MTGLKRICVGLLCLTFAAMPPAVFAAEKSSAAVNRLEGSVMLRVGYAKAFVDRVQTQIDSENPAVAPVEMQDRVFVPLRFAAESLHAAAEWDEQGQTATVTAGGTVIVVRAGKPSYTLNGTERALDVPAFLQDGRMFLPLRAVSEALGQTVFWDDSGLIILSTKEHLFDPVRERKLIELLTALF